MKGHNNRIEINPRIMLGKPVIKGTRIPVYVLLDLLAKGKTIETILDLYPSIQKDDVIAAIRYASQMAQYKDVELEYGDQ